MMGLSGFRDENMEERREKLASEHQIEVIKKEARAAKLMTDRSFGVEGKKDPWVPDRRLTWAENLDERKRLEDEGLVERGMDPTKRPSWDKPVLKGRRSVPPAEAKKVFMGLDKVEWIAIDEADIVLSESLLSSSTRRSFPFPPFDFSCSRRLTLSLSSSFLFFALFSRPRLHRPHRTCP